MIGGKNLTSKLFLLIALEFMAYKPRSRIYGFRGHCLELLLLRPWSFEDDFGRFLLGEKRSKKKSSLCLMTELHVLNNTFPLL